MLAYIPYVPAQHTTKRSIRVVLNSVRKRERMHSSPVSAGASYGLGIRTEGGLGN